MLFKCLVLMSIGLIAASTDGKKQTFDPIKQAYLKRQIRQAEANGAPVRVEQVPQSVPQQPVTIPVPTNMAEACTSAECSSRGTCFGTKASPLCLCQLGFTGPRCEDTYCDSNKSCNGHGICMGSSRQFSCICNLGFFGERCENEANQQQTVVVVQTTPTPVAAPAAASNSQNGPSHH
uniref:EGF-like domain-containing protein n=1 Tax=Panagrolaimus sp. JU765 TaxID=591449 RepID=A0AC34QJY3_9BILA